MSETAMLTNSDKAKPIGRQEERTAQLGGSAIEGDQHLMKFPRPY